MFILNRYSWILIFTFICSWIVMERFSGSNIFEGFIIALPLLCLTIYLSEIRVLLKNKNQFIWIFIIICISFYLGGLLNIIVDYNNTDLRGWWPLYLYAIFVIGLMFSLIYTLICYYLNLKNQYYIFCCSSILILALGLQKFFPPYVVVFANLNTYTLNLFFFSLIIVHLITAVGIKIFKSR